MSRNPSAPQVLVALAALVFVGLGIVVLQAGDGVPDALETTASDVELATPAAAATSADAAPATPAASAEPQTIRLPVASDGAANQLRVLPGAPSTQEPKEAPAAPAAEPELAPSTTAPPALEPSTTAAPAPEPEPEPQPVEQAAPAPAPAPAPEPEPTPVQDNPLEVNGYDVHAFMDHAVALLGPQMLAPSQQYYGGYQVIGPYEVRARSPISALHPVIEQGISDVKERNPDLSGEDLERAIAKRLTELNDWKNLNDRTQENMMILSGVDIQAMDKRLREDTVNHLLHSPMPFGDMEEVLTPDVTVDLGYTHTLDKDWTQAAHLGDGVFQIWMVSNNNNGSHTGHTLGSFKVQLTPTTSIDEARRIGNEMVRNKNKNGKLYLDEAARKILYGETPPLDFSGMTEEEKLATYSGRGLGGS